jgi:hypothetical protein
MSVLFTMAKFYRDAERYEDTCHYMRLYVQELVADGKHLNTEERTQLDAAYKCVSASLRKVIKMLKGTFKEHPNDTYGLALDEYKLEAQKKLTLVCNEILELLENTLIPGAEKENNMEMLICYRTMAGDYHRYLAEITDGSAQQAGIYYKLAHEDAQKLSPTSVVRLGVANNYSVYCYEVLDDPQRACDISLTASSDASVELDTLAEKDKEACQCIIQVLIANCEHWSI